MLLSVVWMSLSAVKVDFVKHHGFQVVCSRRFDGFEHCEPCAKHHPCVTIQIVARYYTLDHCNYLTPLPYFMTTLSSSFIAIQIVARYYTLDHCNYLTSHSIALPFLHSGTDPTKMTITWSSPWTTTIPSGQTGTPTTPASQCKYATDQTSLAYSTASTTQQVPLYAEGTVDSYQFQSYSAGVGIGSTKAATGALFPIYSSPVLHYVK